MKKFVLLLGLLLLASPVAAEITTYCYWDGSEGVRCQNDSRGYINVAEDVTHPVTAKEADLNVHGFYKLVVTQPTLGADQVKSLEQWSFADNEIGLTWAVRDLLQDEIDERDSGAMPLSEYYLWKALIAKGVITQAEAVSALPQEIIDAYLARQRLEQ